MSVIMALALVLVTCSLKEVAPEPLTLRASLVGSRKNAVHFALNTKEDGFDDLLSRCGFP